MRYSILFCFIGILFNSCDQTSEEKKPIDVTEKAPVFVSKLDIEVYQLNTDPLIDSLLTPIKTFQAFQDSMENLIKLKPEGITPFLLGTLVKCNALLKQEIPSPFNTPEIQSRLKVVKTELLKARYYGLEEMQKELDQSMEALFIAYRAYLKRIEDLSQDVQEEGENGSDFTNKDQN